jgi:hypothetical protein
MKTSDSNRRPSVAVIDPCGVCRQRVGVNSIRCTACMCWVHKRCSKIRGSLNSVKNFVCESCANPASSVTTSEEDFGELERLDKTWDNTARELMKARRLSEVDALDRNAWRSMIQRRPANLSQLGQGRNR